MAKAPKPLTDYLVYVAVRTLVAVIQAVPHDWAYSFARTLGFIVHLVDKRHRKVAAENLTFAFPELYGNAQTDPEQRKALETHIRGVYNHFCLLLVEMILLPRIIRPENWRKHLVIDRPDTLIPLLVGEKPVLLITSHHGNWEMGGYLMGLVGIPSFAIARVLDNPYLENFLLGFRERTGQKILAKKGEFEMIEEVLAQGGKLATLADQDAGPKGVFVDFFGRPASTHKAVAFLALEYKVPMLVIGTPRIGGPLEYRIEVEDIIHPEEYSDRPDACKAVTERFTRALERIIRRHPEQYLWLHRRWKHAPPTRKKANREKGQTETALQQAPPIEA